jgi:hypothetical protein
MAMNPTTAEMDAEPRTERTQPGLGYYARKGLKALASLQLTVVLFALSIGLVFFGTLAQRDAGVWTVVEDYFWSWIVWIPLDLINQFGQVFFKEQFPKGTTWSGSFPFPSGKLLGGAMLINLLAAHLVRFRLTWKRSGVLILHSGLILLFVGEFITREYAVEQRMIIDEGQTVDFAEDSKKFELAMIDRSDAREDQVTAIPESVLRGTKDRITDAALPVDVEVVQYMVNSRLEKPTADKPSPVTAGNMATPGAGQIAVEVPEVSGVDPNQKVDIPSVYVKFFKKGTDQELGTYLLSVWLKDDSLEVDGKKYDLAFRFKRYYKPYRIKLIDFRFDRYLGTEKAKNYSSEVVLIDPEMGLERNQTIRMNEPLRHRGETFYQSNFMNEGKDVETTVLQVVKNPGWLIPYISCILVSVGMLLHFGIYLNQFLTRRAAI